MDDGSPNPDAFQQKGSPPDDIGEVHGFDKGAGDGGREIERLADGHQSLVALI